jgi:uncharacterized protein (TIRG00374 family)
VSSRARRLLRIAIGFAATGAFLALFARQVDMSDVLDRFASLPWWATVGGAAAVVVNLVFMSVRWQFLLLAAGYGVPLRPLVSAAAVGQAASNILPFRGGDVVRIESVREHGVPAFAVVGSLLAEKVLDGISLAAWIVIGSLLLGRVDAMLAIGLTLLVLASVGVLVLNLAARRRAAVVRVTGAIAHGLREEWRERVEREVEHFVAGLGAIADRRLLGLALAASGAMWLADVVMYGLVGKAYGLDVGIGAYFLLEGVANLALAIPAAAAGIGTFDYITLVAAQAIGIPTAEATAYVLTVHMLTVVPITLMGLFMLRRAFPRLLAREHS